ncbi:hypothetical protein KRMM14A1004_59930 [Krasilnikovia sp. MM14-A1004]
MASARTGWSAARRHAFGSAVTAGAIFTALTLGLDVVVIHVDGQFCGGSDANVLHGAILDGAHVSGFSYWMS